MISALLLSRYPSTVGITTAVANDKIHIRKLARTIKRAIPKAYLLIAGILGLVCWLFDRLAGWLVSPWFRRRPCTVPTAYYHATSVAVATLDLETGMGQLGRGFYLHVGFVSPSDDRALQITGSAIDDCMSITTRDWAYIVTVGHYALHRLLDMCEKRHLVVWANRAVDVYLLTHDRVMSPEVAYPGWCRQIRLADSVRNREWLEAARIEWVRLSTKEPPVVLSETIPQFAWHTR